MTDQNGVAVIERPAATVAVPNGEMIPTVIKILLAYLAKPVLNLAQQLIGVDLIILQPNGLFDRDYALHG